MGIKIGFISSRDSKALRDRSDELGIKDKIFGAKDKTLAFKELTLRIGINPKRTIYRG